VNDLSFHRQLHDRDRVNVGLVVQSIRRGFEAERREELIDSMLDVVDVIANQNESGNGYESVHDQQ
jgi:hypothetical protein